ncbi:MAG: hypothetical protein PVH00_03515 [Gemmatimonadota bacterium]|jgi:hypothetical protein
MERMRILLVIGLALAACGGPADDVPGSDTLELQAEEVSGLPLERILQRLETQLDSAIDEGLGAGSVHRLAAAEAITDRLIETGLPFQWTRVDDGYSVEARLRQIQALADRVMAQTRGGVDRDSLEAGVLGFRDAIRGLREDLESGGGTPPVPVGNLLRAMDTMR